MHIAAKRAIGFGPPEPIDTALAVYDAIVGRAEAEPSCTPEYHESLKTDARQWDPTNKATDLPGEIRGAPTKGKPLWEMGSRRLQLSNCPHPKCGTTISREVRR